MDMSINTSAEGPRWDCDVGVDAEYEARKDNEKRWAGTVRLVKRLKLQLSFQRRRAKSAVSQCYSMSHASWRLLLCCTFSSARLAFSPMRFAFLVARLQVNEHLCSVVERSHVMHRKRS